MVVPPKFSELVSKSDYIVRAVVVSVTSEYRVNGAHRHIITKVALDVREVISGTPPLPLVLVMVGGKVGDEELRVDGAPKFSVGDEDILFIHGNGRQLNPLVALMHGRYSIKREAGTGREYMTRNNGAPLTSEQGVAQPMADRIISAQSAQAAPPALSPTEFTNRIRTTVTQQVGRPALEN